MKPQPRLPLRPLLVASGAAADPYPIAALARRIDANVRAVWRWHQRGVTITWADVAAVRCGFHPAEVWGDAWWEACERMPEPVSGSRDAVERRRAAQRARDRARGHHRADALFDEDGRRLCAGCLQPFPRLGRPGPYPRVCTSCKEGR